MNAKGWAAHLEDDLSPRAFFVERNVLGPRLYVRGHRIHHWPLALAGCFLFAAWFWSDHDDFIKWAIR
jgi:hypothetical protein